MARFTQTTVAEVRIRFTAALPDGWGVTCRPVDEYSRPGDILVSAFRHGHPGELHASYVVKAKSALHVPGVVEDAAGALVRQHAWLQRAGRKP